MTAVDFNEWRKLMAAMPDHDARLESFHQAAFDIGSRLGNGLAKPDAVDGLIDMAEANNFFDRGRDHVERIIGEQFGRAETEAERVPTLDYVEETVRGWEQADKERAARNAKARDAKPGDEATLTEMPILALDDWLKRDLPEPDFLLGELLSTTSRAIMNAPTGIGKTMFLVGMFMGMSAGLGFLRWPSVRPARILFVDGEMSRRLLKQRLAEEVNRLGVCPKNMHVLSREDVQTFAPLNTRAGQMIIERMIEYLGGIDIIGFDNVMSLIGGDMKDEETWRQTLPWALSLTRRNIGQFWLHHTGHDESRGYGTKTREWQMSTVGHLEEIKRPDTDVSFLLKFPKARERTPANRADFADLKVALVNDRWTWQVADGVGKKSVAPLAMKFYDALVNATIGNGVARMHGCPTASIEEWRGECFKVGLLDKDKPNSASAMFSKYRLALIAANWIACNETMAWTLPN